MWSEGVKACKQLAVTVKTIMRPVCRKCGSIAKSGQSSCCGRGGSWFRNCGRSGNAKLRHTWYEGIQACKTRSQSKAVFGRQTNATRQLKPSNGAAMANFAVIMSAINMSTATSHSTSAARDTGTATSNAIAIAASFEVLLLTAMAE